MGLSNNPAFTSLLRSNHNITFVASSNNAVAVIYYITNYTIKRNYS